MVTTDRWQRAQQYEAGYWEQLAHRIDEGGVGQFEWYQWRADQLAQKLRASGLETVASGSARIIEVGSGPVGVAGFFPAAKAVAVDPLADFYAANATLTTLRNPAVRYVQAGGESLPSEDASFDLAIIENCIDHVRDVGAVMRELRRVLVPGGVLYLTVNCRTRWGFVVHRMLSRSKIDAGHPHTFTPARARRMVARYGFDLRHDELYPTFWQARKADLASRSARARIKGLIGVSEATLTTIATRAG